MLRRLAAVAVLLAAIPAAGQPPTQPSTATQTQVNTAVTWDTGALDVLAGEMLWGERNFQGVPEEVLYEVRRRATVKQSQLEDIINSGRKGEEVIEAVRRVERPTADVLENVINNLTEVPTDGVLGAREARTWNMISKLAVQADPSWSPQKYGALQKLRMDYYAGQRAQDLFRSRMLLDAAKNVLKAVNGLPPDDVIRTDDPTYAEVTGTSRNFVRIASVGVSTVTNVQLPIDSSARSIRESLQQTIGAAMVIIDEDIRDWRQYFPGDSNLGPFYDHDKIAALKAIEDRMDPSTGQITACPPVS